MSPRIRFAAAAVLIAVLIYALAFQQPNANESFGYKPDPVGAEQYNKTLPSPSFALAAPDAMERVVPANTFLWRQMDAAHRARYNGVPFRCSSQKIGSCVAHGAAHACFCSEAVAWAAGERDEPPLLSNQAAIYGGSRVEAAGKSGMGDQPVGGYSDGSTGYRAAKFLREWGVVYKMPYPSADCTESTPEMEKEYGAYGCGGKSDGGKLDLEAKKTPCLYVAQVKNYDELVAAISSGHPVTLASSQGFSRTLDKDSFARAQGVWMHQMCCIGIRVDIEGAAIINSWGDYLTYTAPTRFPADLPDGVFWCDKATMQRILGQGDCWAISEVQFKSRDISHNNWMEARK